MTRRSNSFLDVGFSGSMSFVQITVDGVESGAICNCAIKDYDEKIVDIDWELFGHLVGVVPCQVFLIFFEFCVDTNDAKLWIMGPTNFHKEPPP